MYVRGYSLGKWLWKSIYAHVSHKSRVVAAGSKLVRSDVNVHERRDSDDLARVS